MTCPYCHLYTATPCEVCQNTPSRRRKNAPKAGRKRTIKHESTSLSAEIAGDLDELYAMLRDGRLHSALGYGKDGKRYHAVVDRLLAGGYAVESYRYRVVSGLDT